MKPYPKYKPSGVPWLGDVPEHWEVKKAKYAVTCNDDVLPEDFAADAEISYVEISDVEEGVGIKGWTEVSFKDAPSRARRKVQDGDIIISTVRTYLKAIAPIANPPDNLVVSTGFAVLRPHAMSPSFAKYAFSESGFINTVLVRSTGVSYPAINATDLVRIPIPVPGDEQEAIAAYLDTETARINILVSEKEKLIELLREYRQSVITEAVTKGLNPDVPTKDSGVPWLGDVPKHWAIRKIKHWAEKSGVSFTDGDWVESPFITDAGIRLIQTGNIGIGYYKEQGYRYISPESFIELNCTEVFPGDVLICRLADPVGRACLAPDLGVRMITSVDVCILRPAKSIDPRYAVYFMSSREYLQHIESTQRGGTRDRISRTMLGNTSCLEPPPAEQRAIADHLDIQTAKIDDLIAHVQKEIELLRELRSATITDAVLGRIDLRDYTKNKQDKASELQPAL